MFMAKGFLLAILLHATADQHRSLEASYNAQLEVILTIWTLRRSIRLTGLWIESVFWLGLHLAQRSVMETYWHLCRGGAMGMSKFPSMAYQIENRFNVVQNGFYKGNELVLLGKIGWKGQGDSTYLPIMSGWPCCTVAPIATSSIWRCSAARRLLCLILYWSFFSSASSRALRSAFHWSRIPLMRSQYSTRAARIAGPERFDLLRCQTILMMSYSTAFTESSGRTDGNGDDSMFASFSSSDSES